MGNMTHFFMSSSKPHSLFVLVHPSHILCSSEFIGAMCHSTNASYTNDDSSDAEAADREEMERDMERRQEPERIRRFARTTLSPQDCRL